MNDIGHNSEASADGHLKAYIERFSISEFIEYACSKEIWKPVVGFYRYEVSTFGNVRKIGSKNNLKFNENIGYHVVSVSENIGVFKSRRINVLVAEAFLGSKPFLGAIVAHSDGNKANNILSNLRWASARENQFDRIRHHTRTRGSDVHGAKLKEGDIPIILARIHSGERYPLIASDYNVSVSTICLIKKRTIWKCVTGAAWREVA